MRHYLFLLSLSIAVFQGQACRSFNFAYGLTEACFYDPFSPLGCDGLLPPSFRRARSGSDGPAIAASTSPELAAILNASAPLDSGFLGRVVQAIREERSSEQQGRQRRFFGAGYLIGFAYTAPLYVVPAEEDDNPAGFINVRLDISVAGIEVNSAYAFAPSDGGEERRVRGSPTPSSSEPCVGSLHTQETIGFWEIESLFNPGNDPDSPFYDFTFRNKEAFGKSLDFLNKQVTLQVAAAPQYAAYVYTLNFGAAVSANNFERQYLGILGGIGVLVLVGAGFVVKRKMEKPVPVGDEVCAADTSIAVDTSIVNQ